MVIKGTDRNLGEPGCSCKVIYISTEKREDVEKIAW
jgi:hypothetical protein